MRAFVLAAGLSLAAAAASAASLTQTYSSFLVFGDSLSDAGNVFAATPNDDIPLKLPPSPPYFEGRFSNGPVWNEPIAAEFRAAGRVAGNFAFGFATASVDGPSVDFAEQRGLFGAFAAGLPAGALGPRPLASVWFGANDVFGAVDAGADVATAQLVGVAAAQDTAAGIVALSGLGVTDFLLFDLPDLGRTPAYAALQPGRGRAGTAGALAFNARLAVEVEALRALGLSVTTVDVEGLFDALLEDPADFGLTDPTTACIEGAVLEAALGLVAPCASADGLAFWDSVHPTAAVHAAIADEARAALAPIPLPGALPLLAAALGALALARSRRRD